MHHIPTAELRIKLLKELTKSKVAIVSFWQFEKDTRIFNKAQETTKLAQDKLGFQNLEAGDYFLGWKDRDDVFRFCHNFTNDEVDAIASKFNVIDSFTADKLNKYIVLSK